MTEVPGAVSNVDLRVVEIRDPEAASAGMDGDPFRGVREELHQSDRTRVRASVRLELGLLVDDRREQGGIEVVVARVAAHDLLVAKRIEEPLPPPRVLRLEQRERAQDSARQHDDAENPPHAVNRRITPATNSSSSSKVPSFTYA